MEGGKKKGREGFGKKILRPEASPYPKTPHPSHKARNRGLKK